VSENHIRRRPLLENGIWMGVAKVKDLNSGLIAILTALRV
jgi:hypothetical protein